MPCERAQRGKRCERKRARPAIGPGGHDDCEARERSERRRGPGAEARGGIDQSEASASLNVADGRMTASALAGSGR
jgi:hypothetical protein